MLTANYYYKRNNTVIESNNYGLISRLLDMCLDNDINLVENSLHIDNGYIYSYMIVGKICKDSLHNLIEKEFQDTKINLTNFKP